MTHAVPFDLGIRCDYFFPLVDGKATVLRDWFIGIRGSKIEVIEKYANQTATQFLNAKNQVVMPGLINGHTHLPMTLFRGLSDDLPFQEWLFGNIIPKEAKLVNPEFVRLGTELAALEMIRTGTTTACDMYYFEKDIAETWNQAGLRGFFAEAVMDFPAPDSPAGSGNNWKILEEMVETYQGHDRIYTALGPHAPYSVSDDLFKKCRDFSIKHQLPIFMHVCETEHEVQESIKQHGLRPIERLNRLGMLDVPSSWAHGVHITPEEMTLLASKKIGIIHNPESNSKIAVGICPVVAHRSAGVAVGLGTDGAASNNNLNMFGEMDFAAKLQKLDQKNSSRVGAIDVLNLATLDGARAIHMEKSIGSLEVGKLADLIFVSLEDAHMQPVHSIPSQLVYSATGYEVTTVVCHGKVLYQDGEYQTLDEERILRETRDLVARIF